MPRFLLPISLALTLGLVACPSPPDPPPGPGAGGSNMATPSPSSKGGPSQPPSKGQSGGPPPGSQPAARNPTPVGSSTASGNPTGPPVPPAEGPHANEFDPNAGKGTENDPMAQDLRLVPPQMEQAAVKSGEYYTVKGTISGSCDGNLRIDVLEDLKEPPAPGSAPPGPLTATTLSKPGSYAVAVPEGKTVMLSAVCDSNKDGIVSGTEPVSAPGTAEGISRSKSGVDLELTAQGR